jgi:hypothetical protein
MKLTAFAAITILLVLPFFAGCGKKEKTAAQLRHASPTPTPTPHVYKLGEPRPITLNVEKPLIVPVATPTPKPTPRSTPKR